MDLGEAMARSAGWTEDSNMGWRDDRAAEREGKRIARIETHKFCTPTAVNRAVPYSVGVMNLTEDEAEIVISFARSLERDRLNTALPGARSAAMNARERREAMIRGNVFDVPGFIRDEIIKSEDPPVALTQWKCINGHPLPNRTARCDACVTANGALYANREQSVRNDMIKSSDEPPVVKPARNRFSGLDIE